MKAKFGSAVVGFRLVNEISVRDSKNLDGKQKYREINPTLNSFVYIAFLQQNWNVAADDESKFSIAGMTEIEFIIMIFIKFVSNIFNQKKD